MPRGDGAPPGPVDVEELTGRLEIPDDLDVPTVQGQLWPGLDEDDRSPASAEDTEDGQQPQAAAGAHPDEPPAREDESPAARPAPVVEARDAADDAGAAPGSGTDAEADAEADASSARTATADTRASQPAAEADATGDVARPAASTADGPDDGALAPAEDAGDAGADAPRPVAAVETEADVEAPPPATVPDTDSGAGTQEPTAPVTADTSAGAPEVAAEVETASEADAPGPIAESAAENDAPHDVEVARTATRADTPGAAESRTQADPPSAAEAPQDGDTEATPADERAPRSQRSSRAAASDEGRLAVLLGRVRQGVSQAGQALAALKARRAADKARAADASSTEQPDGATDDAAAEAPSPERRSHRQAGRSGRRSKGEAGSRRGERSSGRSQDEGGGRRPSRKVLVTGAVVLLAGAALFLGGDLFGGGGQPGKRKGRKAKAASRPVVEAPAGGSSTAATDTGPGPSADPDTPQEPVPSGVASGETLPADGALDTRALVEGDAADGGSDAALPASAEQAPSLPPRCLPASRLVAEVCLALPLGVYLLELEADGRQGVTLTGKVSAGGRLESLALLGEAIDALEDLPFLEQVSEQVTYETGGEALTFRLVARWSEGA